MSDTTNDSESTRRPPRSLNFGALKDHVIAHKIDVALWAIRIFTILFAFAYFIPIFGNSYNAFYKVLFANAATAALRLHQRLGGVQFTREFFAKLMMEDSFHNLIYSFIFIYVTPVTLVIIPIVLFAILHAASYSLTLLDVLGQNAWWGARLLISLVEFQSMNILRLIAFTEIINMPLSVVLVLTGKAGFHIPVMYYHFLTRRYASRRNPYTRNMFRELRLLLESTASKPSLPGFLRNFMLGVVNFTLKLAPPMIPSPQPSQQSQQ